MPFNIKDFGICGTCTHGFCLGYVDGKLHRRTTVYRLKQNPGMACTFENFIPGFSREHEPTQTFAFFLKRLVENAKAAGLHLHALVTGPFGTTAKPFALTEAQCAKVMGDVFDVLCRAVIWNCCAYHNAKILGRPLPFKFVPEPLGKAPSVPFPSAVVSLGRDYDLKRLFDADSAKIIETFEGSLKQRGTALCYSTPDAIAVRIDRLPKDIQQHFSNPISSLGKPEQIILEDSRELLEGRLRPEDFIFAVGLKTSIRSDRLYQFLFEANAWKFIWRRVFKQEPVPYYAVADETFGALLDKMDAVEFSSITADAGTCVRAIDETAAVGSPIQLMAWLARTLLAPRTSKKHLPRK